MSTPWPASIPIARSRLVLNENKGVSESLFTRRRQVVSLSAGTADRWEGLVETVPLIDVPYSSMLSRTMWAFLAGVGYQGEITLGDPDYPQSAGPQSAIASALVRGAGQGGTSLNCDGVTPSVTVLRAGEYFQVGTGFHLVTADCSSNGAGEFTVAFKPALRASPADNASVQFTNPVMTARITSMPERGTDAEKRGVFVVSFEESL